MRTNFNANVAFVRGTGFERVLTRANYVHVIIGGMYSSFHIITIRETSSYHTRPSTPKHNPREPEVYPPGVSVVC